METNATVKQLIDTGILNIDYAEEALNDKQRKHVYAVTYDYVPDILERRGQHRVEHLQLSSKYVEDGKAILGGAWGNPINGALLIFHVNRIEDVYDFFSADPYVRNGLVTKINVRPWNIIVGSLQTHSSSPS